MRVGELDFDYALNLAYNSYNDDVVTKFALLIASTCQLTWAPQINSEVMTIIKFFEFFAQSNRSGQLSRRVSSHSFRSELIRMYFFCKLSPCAFTHNGNDVYSITYIYTYIYKEILAKYYSPRDCHSNKFMLIHSNSIQIFRLNCL